MHASATLPLFLHSGGLSHTASNSVPFELPWFCLYLPVYIIIETSSNTGASVLTRCGCRLLLIVEANAVVHKPRGISSKSRWEFRVCRGGGRQNEEARVWRFYGSMARCWKFCGINFAPSMKLSEGKFHRCPAACKFSHYVEGDDLRRRIPLNFRSRQHIWSGWRIFHIFLCWSNGSIFHLFKLQIINPNLLKSICINSVYTKF